MEFDQAESTGLRDLGSFLAAARLERGLSQAELAARCGLSQAQISYFEIGRRRPTLDQLVRIARSLDVSIERLIAGSDRPGDGLRDIAIELRHLGLVDLWVADPIVPGAFRRPEEVIARAVAGHEPDPRILEAIPAILAWNRINPVLLRAYGLTTRPRVTRRLAWLADIALAIDRRGGFPGGCRKEPLARFTQMIPAPSPESDEWDSLGRPMAERSDLAHLEAVADQLRRRPDAVRTAGQASGRASGRAQSLRTSRLQADRVHEAEDIERRSSRWGVTRSSASSRPSTRSWSSTPRRGRGSTCT